MLSISLLYPKDSFTSSCFEQLRRKDFSMEQLPIDSYYDYVNKIIILQLINISLAFNLTAF